MITLGRRQSLAIFDIARRATQMYVSSVGDGDATSAADAAAGPTSEDVGSMSDADIEELDAATLRRLLASLGLPASGKLSKLRERLAEARANSAA